MMAWVFGVLTALGAAILAVLIVRFLGPRVPEARIVPEDVDLARDDDLERWRQVRLATYRTWKRHDDFYRIAAFRKHVAAGLPEPEARAQVRKDFPIYYLDPADRDTEGYAGDDGALPVVLRERVDRNARVLKEYMEEKGGSFRTMNALIRLCLRKGVF